MAYQLAKLADPAYLGSSLASFYANPSSTKTFVRSILLHNTNTTAETVELNFVPDSSGSLGTASAANRIFRRALIADETFELALQFPIVLTDTNDSLQGKSTTASKVVVVPLGDTNV